MKRKRLTKKEKQLNSQKIRMTAAVAVLFAAGLLSVKKSPAPTAQELAGLTSAPVVTAPVEMSPAKKDDGVLRHVVRAKGRQKRIAARDR